MKDDDDDDDDDDGDDDWNIGYCPSLGGGRRCYGSW